MNIADPFLAIDRAHELAGEADDAFDTQLAIETKRQAAVIRAKALGGNKATLSGLAESLALRLSVTGLTEYLVRFALSCGPEIAGQALIKLIDDCIDEDAETAALVKLTRGVTT